MGQDQAGTGNQGLIGGLNLEIENPFRQETGLLRSIFLITERPWSGIE